MCGIIFLVAQEEKRKEVNSLLEIIKHRGVDYRGIEIIKKDQKYIHLGHNRLSINDLSPKGNQPLIYKGCYLIVNGEIWNYKQLIKKYNFKCISTSDSEVILFLYLKGKLQELDGMFSFVLYDSNINKVFISRDWVGKIPLFYNLPVFNNSFIKRDFLVSSELKAFKNNKGVKFVPKNSLVEINLSNNKSIIKSKFYFEFNSKKISNISFNMAVSKTRALLFKAVEKRLISDVPIATLNSGGIDSSVITYILKEHIQNLTCYTVKFENDGVDLIAARQLADFLKINLVEVQVPKEEQIIKDKFLEAIRVIEYPSTVQVEVGILLSFLIKKIKKDGYKVLFSGEGADESYGSYGFIRQFSNKPDFSDIRKKLFEKQYYGNLIRGNNIGMFYGTLEIRTPFFDRDFLNFTLNLDNKYLSKKNHWKILLREAFKNDLPDLILDRPKMNFQKGCGFKEYIEKIILNDKKINFKNRKNMFHCIVDNYKKEFSIDYRSLK